MKRLLVALIPLLLAVPAFAGTVYVPYAASFEVGGVTYETRIWLTNAAGVDATVEYLHIPTFRDGTNREEMEPSELTVGANDTELLIVDGNRGWLEVFAPEDVLIDARLVPVAGGLSGPGVDLPVVSSDTVVPAGEEAHVLGWERAENGGRAFTHFGLLNLGHQEATCLIDILSPAGTRVINDLPLSIKALSHNQFNQALGILGRTDASNWRSAVSCDQPFFSYVSVGYPLTGQVAFIGPAESGRSLLERPLGGGVSGQFDYLSDLPVDRWGGLKFAPLIDRSGYDPHAAGGPRRGHLPIKIQGVTYDKGIAFMADWNVTPFVEFQLGGQYALFTATVRIDDSYNGHYEWAIVDGDNRWVRLERPPDGYRGRERSNPIRVGGAMTFQVTGDGEVLYQSPEVYAYGDAVVIEVDVRGVDVLRLQGHPDGTEQLGAPHRRGLSSPRLVRRCPWKDLVDFADAKLFYPE